MFLCYAGSLFDYLLCFVVDVHVQIYVVLHTAMKSLVTSLYVISALEVQVNM